MNKTKLNLYVFQKYGKKKKYQSSVIMKAHKLKKDKKVDR